MYISLCMRLACMIMVLMRGSVRTMVERKNASLLLSARIDVDPI